MVKFRINEDNLENFFCCTALSDKICESVVEEHLLGYVVSGEMSLVTKTKNIHVRNREAIFIRRNHLVTKRKSPGKNGEPFKALFINFSVPFLKSIVRQIPVPAVKSGAIRPDNIHIYLPEHPFLTGLFQSLDSYFTSGERPSPMLVENKLHEAVLVLLELKPELAAALFDFENPWKTDLRDFMNDNFTCDLSVEQFAHYTGRSLSAFKRDFANAFTGATPSRWIMARRLDKAMSLLKSGLSVSDTYLKAGFKNFSHFSTAFKRRFGVSPTQILAD